MKVFDLTTSHCTYPWHVFHENGQDLLALTAAEILHNALVLDVLEKLDLALQGLHLLQPEQGRCTRAETEPTSHDHLKTCIAFQVHRWEQLLHSIWLTGGQNFWVGK